MVRGREEEDVYVGKGGRDGEREGGGKKGREGR